MSSVWTIKTEFGLNVLYINNHKKQQQVFVFNTVGYEGPDELQTAAVTSGFLYRWRWKQTLERTGGQFDDL